MIDEQELISGLNSAIDRLLSGDPPVAVEEDVAREIRPYVEIFALLLETAHEPARPEFRANLRARFVGGAEAPGRQAGALGRVAAFVAGTFLVGSAVNPVLARNLVNSIGDTMGQEVAQAVERLLDAGPLSTGDSPRHDAPASGPSHAALDDSSPDASLLDSAPGDLPSAVIIGVPETVSNSGGVPAEPAPPAVPPVSTSSPPPAPPASTAGEPGGKPAAPPAPAAAPPTQHVPPGPAAGPPGARPATGEPVDPAPPDPAPTDPPATAGDSPAEPSPDPSPDAPGNGKGNAYGRARGDERGHPPEEPGKSAQQNQKPPSPGNPAGGPSEASQAADVHASANPSQGVGPVSRPDVPAVHAGDSGAGHQSEARKLPETGKAQSPNFPAT